MAEADNDRDVIQWLNGRNNWLSDAIQNEIIKLFSDTISDESSKSLFFGIVADDTTDISGMEQFSICI